MSKLQEARRVIVDLGLPQQQQNDRTAYCLLALLNMTPNQAWADAESPLMGVTPIMTWVRLNYKVKYAPNTRETFRRQSLHQFVSAGVCLYNPDKPSRPVNSPNAVYQIDPNLLEVLKTYGSPKYEEMLSSYLDVRQTLVDRYAMDRAMEQVPVQLNNGSAITLSPGDHSELIKAIVEDFGSRYASGGELLYVGDTGSKHSYFDTELLAELGVVLDGHGKLPDVLIYLRAKNWLLLIESVTSHGPVDGKRQEELSELFSSCTAGLVYVSAFPNRKTFVRYLKDIAWESEVWIADAPSHLIHFNGLRFLGPYDD